jgi:hypothetical protein
MSSRARAAADNVRRQKVEISPAAVSAVGRLIGSIDSRVATYPARDGGLIVEDLERPGHPRVWRISRDGTVHPDRPYNYLLRAFVEAGLPPGV